jgi:hypothetical protein
MLNLWKSVVEKMFLGLVILASSLSHTRRNVKGGADKFYQGLTTQKYQSLL